MATASIYLDNHATTPLDPVVYTAMQPWWHEHFGNPHSGDHWFGWQAHDAIESARRSVASLINAEPDEIVFTSGATESNNLGVIGAARSRRAERSRIIVSTVEHKCVLASAAALRREGWHVDIVPVDRDGVVRLEVLEALLSEETALVSIMAVNNEVGTIQPIDEIGRLCAAAGAWFHCDAAQAPAAIRINVDQAEITLLSLSSHKIYGPMGVGALYARSDVLSQLEPVTYGGAQEAGIRSGTLPTPLCVGFGRACELMLHQHEHELVVLARKRDKLWNGIQSRLETARINGSSSRRHPGNLNVRFHGYDASALLGTLQPRLAASTGSACTTGIPEPSHVLSALGISLSEAESSIRFGVGRFTTEQDIELAIDWIADALDTTAQAVA